MQLKVQCTGVREYGKNKLVELLSEELKTKLHVAVDSQNNSFKIGGLYHLNIEPATDVSEHAPKVVDEEL